MAMDTTITEITVPDEEALLVLGEPVAVPVQIEAAPVAAPLQIEAASVSDPDIFSLSFNGPQKPFFELPPELVSPYPYDPDVLSFKNFAQDYSLLRYTPDWKRPFGERHCPKLKFDPFAPLAAPASTTPVDLMSQSAEPEAETADSGGLASAYYYAASPETSSEAETVLPPAPAVVVVASSPAVSAEETAVAGPAPVVEEGAAEKPASVATFTVDSASEEVPVVDTSASGSEQSEEIFFQPSLRVDLDSVVGAAIAVVPGTSSSEISVVRMAMVSSGDMAVSGPQNSAPQIIVRNAKVELKFSEADKTVASDSSQTEDAVASPKSTPSSATEASSTATPKAVLATHSTPDAGTTTASSLQGGPKTGDAKSVSNSQNDDHGKAATAAAFSVGASANQGNPGDHQREQGQSDLADALYAEALARTATKAVADEEAALPTTFIVSDAYVS